MARPPEPLAGTVRRPDAEPHGFEELLASVDALLLGRNRCEVVLPFPRWPHGDKPVFVLSSLPLPPAPKGAVVEPLAGPPRHVASELGSSGRRRGVC